MEAAKSFGNYNLAFSLADLIDNSITADATRIDIRTSFADQEIRITDDGCGMSEIELVDNMRMGSRNPNAENKENDLGRFGLGLKTASFAQARKLTVLSRKNGVMTGAEWDLDNVDDWAMTVYSSDEAQQLSSENFPSGSGTEIIWSKLNRLLEDGTVQEKAFNELMSDAENEIRLVFHRYLSGELTHRKKLSITRNNRELIALDPFHQQNLSTQRIDEEPVTYMRDGRKSTIRITPFILPHFSQLSNKDYELLGGEEGFIKSQGFYVYRNYRLIIRGTWFKLLKHDEYAKLARIRVDIPNSLDIDWKLSVDKSEAELPWELRSKLRVLITNWILPNAIGPITQRKTKMKTKIGPVWSRFNSSAGAWHFEINTGHPLISGFLGRLRRIEKSDKEKRLIANFREILRLIQKSLPLEDIKAAMDKKAQTENGDIDLQEILDLAMSMRGIFMDDKKTMFEVENILQETEPFSKYISQIKKHFAENPSTK